jgi:hypothetical protein
VALLLAASDEGVQGIGRALQDCAVAGGDLASHLGIENERGPQPLTESGGEWGILPSFPPALATTVWARADFFRD